VKPLAKKGKTQEFKGFGSWAFVIGFVLAIIFGVFEINLFIAWLLVLLGLVIGFVNIAEEQSQKFLLAGLVLVIVSWIGEDALTLIPVVGSILNAMLIMFIPATVIVALKSVFKLAK
jgi:hypothetical protein